MVVRCWGITTPRKLKRTNYKGRKKLEMQIDGDELCMLDVNKDVRKLVGGVDSFEIAYLIEGRGPEEVIAQSKLGDLDSDGVLKASENIEQSQLDELEHDFCTQNIHEYMEALKHADDHEVHDVGDVELDGVPDVELDGVPNVELNDVTMDKVLNGDIDNDSDNDYYYGEKFGPTIGGRNEADNAFNYESDDEDEEKNN
ncbi:hypothetical protein IFM89_025132 [Coptis chinensis]|uniref:Uncharacterized protein n=1 Tax=Coptis chinensis TaxID=261450 RepID=A0A835IZT5_9MAGN|nr:hypothetical protein IFM89_025132 [Coptis chinensis]